MSKPERDEKLTKAAHVLAQAGAMLRLEQRMVEMHKAGELSKLNLEAWLDKAIQEIFSGEKLGARIKALDWTFQTFKLALLKLMQEVINQKSNKTPLMTGMNRLLWTPGSN